MLGSALLGGFVVYWLSRSRARTEMESIDDWRMKHLLLEEQQNRHTAKFLLLKEQYQRGHEDTIKLKAEINDLKERGNNISRQRDEFETKYIGLMETYQEAIARKDDDHQDRKNQLMSANFKIDQLLDRVSMLSSQKRDVNSNLESIQTERDQLNTQIIDLDGEREDARNHLRLVTDERDKLTQQVDVLNQERHTYENRVDSLIKDQQVLSGQVEELKQERDAYVNRLRSVSESTL